MFPEDLDDSFLSNSLDEHPASTDEPESIPIRVFHERTSSPMRRLNPAARDRFNETVSVENYK
jgi:hypothetical protein